ncbi:MAG: STAS domain-containing protein [Ignavibacteria bacterium]|nr:STAS domain-containing protein [Ignavibacteria bacterium]
MSAFNTHSPADEVVIIRFSANVLGGPDAMELASILRDNVSAGKTKAVFDLSDVSVMNSSGLGMLVSSLSTMKKGNGHLLLACVPDKVSQLLTITQLTQVFALYDSTEEAISAQ